jgi:hypothetical protein
LAASTTTGATSSVCARGGGLVWGTRSSQRLWSPGHTPCACAQGTLDIDTHTHTHKDAHTQHAHTDGQKHNTHTHTHTHTRRYYNDLWELDVGEMVWTPVGDMAAGPWPPARSGCQLMLGGAAAGGDAATVYMYGGYVKVRLCV